MAPRVDFHGQPFEESDAGGAFLRRALSDEAITSLSIAVAWARFRGLARVAADVEAFRTRGGRVEALVGIDEGVATLPGLRKAVAIFDRALVFHDPSGRIFHPKVYLAEGASRASLLVGSNNATAGGLFFNYEASLEAEFRLPDEESDPALTKVRTYLDQLRQDERLCVVLTDEAIDELANDPRYPVAETERWRHGDARSPLPDAAEPNELGAEGAAVGDELSAPIFGESRHRKAPVPPLSAGARQELFELEWEAIAPGTEMPPTPPQRRQDAPVAGDADVVASWTKTLGRADAQQTNNPTGNLRLTQAGGGIDHLSWFRHELFSSVEWRKAHDGHGNPIEEADIRMGVEVAGEDLGTFELRVSHGEHRVASQGNVPTWLHWGTELSAVLRATDYSGNTVAVERSDDGSFRLRVEP